MKLQWNNDCYTNFMTLNIPMNMKHRNFKVLTDLLTLYVFLKLLLKLFALKNIKYTLDCFNVVFLFHSFMGHTLFPLHPTVHPTLKVTWSEPVQHVLYICISRTNQSRLPSRFLFDHYNTGVWKELCFCHKLRFYHLYIIAPQCRKP